MSLKTLTLLVLLVPIWTTGANAEIAFFEGQLTQYANNGSFAQILSEEDLPIAYSGSLEWDFTASEAYLRIEVDPTSYGKSVDSYGNFVDSFGNSVEPVVIQTRNLISTSETLWGEPSAASVEQSGSSLIADFRSSLGLVIVDVELAVDTVSGEGTWRYSFVCPACGFAGLSSAGGTITSFTLVPEPATLPLACLIAMAGFLGQRFRRR